MNIAGQEIACDVLKDGRRILRHRNFAKFMGKSKANSEDMERARTLNLPVFIIANNLTPYLTPVLAERGDDNLKKQLVQIITVMKLSNNLDEFKGLVDKL